ncbi:MAG: alpha/beta hydrolase [Gammaproteobacteria bacterium]|nr:alpha/beta hydrolase [Gammaproteobacteria bacterium]
MPSADGVPIRYRIYSDTAEAAQRPALIFIHGWGADSTYWDAQIDYFAKRHKVVTLDLAGHGDSGILRKRWTMDAFGDDVFAVAQRLPDQQLVLIGHSMGGAVALQAARRLGERVIGIIGADAFQNMANPPAPAQALQRRLEPFRSDFQTAMRDYVARNFFRSSADPELVRRIAEDLASAQPGVVLGSIIAMNEMNYAAAVADVEVPLVAINSDIGPTDAERIRIHAPTFRLKIMRGIGHFVMIEDPLRFNALLDETLGELTGEQR